MVPLSFTFFIYLFGWGLVTPIFNIRINDVTGSLFLSGIVFSIFSFVKIFLDPSIGLLCDKVNPKKILQWTLLSYTVIFFLYTLANTTLELILIRVFHGLAAALLWIAGWTLVRHKSKGRYAQEEISAWITIQDIAYIIAPIIGGFIITAYSWEPAFYLASIISFIAFVYASFRLKSPKMSKNHNKSFKQQWRSFFKDKSSATRLVLLTFLVIVIFTAFGAFLPLQLDSNGISIEEISIILSIATITPYILFPVLIGVLSDKYGRKIPTLIGLLLSAFGLYNFSIISSFTQFFFYTFVIHTGVAFISTSYNAELNDLTPKGQTGGFTGIFEMIKDIAATIGPIIAGFISSIASINYTFLILAFTALGSTLVLKGFKNY